MLINFQQALHNSKYVDEEGENENVYQQLFEAFSFVILYKIINYL